MIFRHARHHTILINISLVLLAIALESCSKASKETVEDNASDSSFYLSEIPDTIPEPKVSISFKDSVGAKKYLRESEHTDKYSGGIFPRMAQDNPDYLAILLDSAKQGFIIIDKGRMKLNLYDCYGRLIKDYGIACSKKFGTKHKKGDNRTPEGFFSVEGIYDSTDWLYTDDNGVTSQKKGQFGPRFIRLLVPRTSAIGVHGTCAPWSIGARASHGCIRMTNENILDLVDRVHKGMPVIVTPGVKDYRTNLEEGYEVPWVASVPGQRNPRVIVGDVKPKEEPVDSIQTVEVEAVDTISVDTAAEEIPEADSVNTDSDGQRNQTPETPVSNDPI